MKKSYVQIDGKLVPKDQATLRADSGIHIMGDIEAFKSPITGEIIKGRAHLRAHMKEHGVTHSQDYSDTWRENFWKNKHRQQQEEGRRHRIELIKRELEK